MIRKTNNIKTTLRTLKTEDLRIFPGPLSENDCQGFTGLERKIPNSAEILGTPSRVPALIKGALIAHVATAWLKIQLAF